METGTGDVLDREEFQRVSREAGALLKELNLPFEQLTTQAHEFLAAIGASQTAAAAAALDYLQSPGMAAAMEDASGILKRIGARTEGFKAEIGRMASVWSDPEVAATLQRFAELSALSPEIEAALARTSDLAHDPQIEAILADSRELFAQIKAATPLWGPYLRKD